MTAVLWSAGWDLSSAPRTSRPLRGPVVPQNGPVVRAYINGTLNETLNEDKKNETMLRERWRCLRVFGEPKNNSKQQVSGKKNSGVGDLTPFRVARGTALRGGPHPAGWDR